MKSSIKHLFILILCIMYASLTVKAQEGRPNFIKDREYPKWFQDAKLGIFIHFGLYSIPSWSGKEQYAEWFYKGLISGDSARINFQKNVFGEDFKYENYKDMFKAELFNADDWANLFYLSGAKYVLLTSKHHDGYCLWGSKYAKGWNSMETAPKRDFCQELTDAVRKKDMEMGLYYSLTEWTNPLYRWTQDTNITIDNYVNQHLIPQFKELVDKFNPSIIFSDGDWDHSYKDFHSDELVGYYYKVVGDKAIVNDRFGKGFNHGYLTPEYSAGIVESERPWAECRGIGRSFGLNRNETLESYKSSDEIIKHFVKLVSLGGGLTLNVGPSADGQIPLMQQERLLDLGSWLQTNKEAIYGSQTFSKPYDQTLKTFHSTDSIIYFNWVRNAPKKFMSEDNFSITWEGNLNIDKTQTYSITCQADDYAIVFLDGKQIIDTRQNIEYKTLLNKNQTYSIKVLYTENTHEASIKLNISSPMEEPKAIKTLWKTSYQWQDVYVCYTTQGDDLYALSYTIPEDSLTLKLDKAPPKNFQIIFLDNPTLHIPYTYKDGNLYIDTSVIKFSHVKSKAVWVFKLPQYLK